MTNSEMTSRETTSREMKVASQRDRSQTVTAAVWVLIRRPAFWLVGIALLIQTGFLVSAVMTGHRSSHSTDNFPRYEPLGQKLWGHNNELALAFQQGQANSSIQSLSLQFVDVSESEGKTLFELDNRSSPSDVAASVEIPLPRFVQFLKTFDHVQWVSLRSKQLAALPADVLNQMPELRSIEFTGDELTEDDLDRLSRLTKIEHLTLEAGWCDHGLQRLAALPNLKSLHLRSRSVKRSQFRPIEATRPFVSVQHIASLKALPKLEELAITDEGKLFNFAFVTGLTSDCRDQYENVVAALKWSPTLKSVYVGRYQRPHGDELFEKMADDLPKLAVHPATFDGSMALSATICNLATMLGLFVLTMHLTTCNSMAQNCLLNGASVAHRKVYLAFATIVLLLPIATILLQTYAHWLPVITFEVCLFACVNVLGGFRPSTAGESESGRSRWRKLTPLLIFPVTGLVVFVWIGNGFYGASVASYFCGHFPATSLFLLVAAAVLLVSSLRSSLAQYRFWAESGLSPAATWTEIGESFTTAQSGRQQQGGVAAALQNRLDRKANQWLIRLNTITHSFRQKPRSPIVRCRLWLAAIIPMSLPRAIFGHAMIWPLCCLWPVFFDLFTVGPSALMESSQLGISIGMGSVCGGFFVFFQWYGRRAMFETEILRPVSRSDWRDTVLQSMLFVIAVVSLIAWGQAHLLRLIAGQHLPVAWVTLSLLAVVAATMLATGLNLWALTQRHVVVAAVLVLATLAAFVPLLFTALPAPDGSSNFSLWLTITLSETILGALILATARSKWGRIEVANR